MNTEPAAIDPTMPQIVLAIFDDQSLAQRAVQALRQRGIADERISVLFRRDQTTISPDQMEALDREADSVGTDVAVGGTVGGLAGLLSGLALFSIPGFGPFLGTGVLVSTLGGAALGSAVGERWAHSHFESVGVPADRTPRYGSALEQGSVILAISAQNADDVMLAREVLAVQQADEIDVYPQRHPTS